MASPMPSLHYMPGDKYCPNHELQTVTAVPFVQIDPTDHMHLEGLIFDRDRNMYVCNIYDSEIWKIDKDTHEVSKFFEYEDKKFCMVAIKIHKDGRFFICGTDMKSEKMGEHGGILIMNPDGSNQKKILEGWNIDDMVFDSKGGFYFTAYTGTPANPTGSIQYVEPDYETVHPVVEHLAAPNGIALSTDEKILWFTETSAGYLHRRDLSNPFHYTTPYNLEGYYGPDSCEVDSDDNLYVAMARQGRCLVFNKAGFLIGQVRTPGSENGRLMGTTHPMVHPDTNVLYLTAHDNDFDSGANILQVGAFAKGHAGAYQFQ